MAADIAAEGGSLAFEGLELVPLSRGRVLVEQGRRFGAAARCLFEHAEQGRLTALTVTARAARTFQRPIDGGKRARATDADGDERGVERAALHQRLEHTAIEPLVVDA